MGGEGLVRISRSARIRCHCAWAQGLGAGGVTRQMGRKVWILGVGKRRFPGAPFPRLSLPLYWQACRCLPQCVRTISTLKTTCRVRTRQLRLAWTKVVCVWADAGLQLPLRAERGGATTGPMTARAREEAAARSRTGARGVAPRDLGRACQRVVGQALGMGEWGGCRRGGRLGNGPWRFVKFSGNEQEPPLRCGGAELCAFLYLSG